MRVRHAVLSLAAIFGLALFLPRSLAAPQNGTPETVMVTYHAKTGSEAALANAIARQWATANNLRLVLGTPHTLVRGSEGAKTYFVEIFTWRDAAIPDAAPAVIQNIWTEMNQLVESRAGRPGIDLTVVSVVAPVVAH
jgi:hypothetical protein